MSRSALTTTLLILLGGACGESRPVDPIVELPGRINLSVLATGGDIDDNGFTVAVGSGALRQVFSIVATTAVFDFAAGTHPVMLESISPNCSVTGDNPRSVTVVTGATTDVSFALTCEATGITVTSRTTGFNMPSNYELLVGDNLRRLTIPVNGSSMITRLSAGVHTVTLDAAENCTVAGGKSVTVEVVNRTVTPLAFEVDCGAVTVRLEKIAYTNNYGDGERFMVGTVRPDGTSPVDLTEGHSPTWSRDGAQLLFSKMECSYQQSYNGEMCSGSLAIVDPETRAVTTIANTVGATEPAWSPAMNEIVFVRCCEEADWEQLYLMRIDGSTGGSPVPIVFQSTDILPSYARNPAWSPDGQRIAFTCRSGAGSSTDICVVKRDGTGLVRLRTGAVYDEEPAWSPDGRSIAFTSWTSGQPATVNVIAAEGGPITTLTVGARPAWSGDGKKLVFDHNQALYTMNADGTNVKQLLPANRYDAAWRP